MGGAEPERERERVILVFERGGEGGGGERVGETFRFRGERDGFFVTEGERERDGDEEDDREDREREDEVDLRDGWNRR